MKIGYVKFTESVRIGEAEKSSLTTIRGEFSVDMLKNGSAIKCVQLTGKYKGSSIIVPMFNICYLQLLDESENG